MLEDQVAFLLQKYLGNYVKGLSAEALKISVWKGDVELKNMQLKPEALNALKLPVRVKAGFLGSVRLKVPWSKLGQEPVQVYLDSIFVLAEPATTVETSSQDAVQEMKKRTVQELERKLLEARQQQKSEVNASWLGSLINTIIGNLKLSINNIHIRYEDVESNPGHPFACGVTLEKLSAITVDDNGVETFVTGGALDHVLKSVNLQRLALYFDPDTPPWSIQKPWGELLPSEWSKVFEFGADDASAHSKYSQSHSYLLEPVSGVGNYAKFRPDKMREPNQPLQRSIINLEDVILSLSKDGYRDILKMADNFSAFNKRLSYAHYRPTVNIKSNPKIWWRYAYKVVSEQSKKASGRLSWDQVLRYTRLRKRYITLYASLLKSETSHPIVEHNKDIDELDRELDVEVILQWRMLAHKFVEQTTESNVQQKQQEKKPWWSLWNTQSANSGNSAPTFSQEDWRQLNQIIGYKDDGDMHSVAQQEKGLQALFEVHMKRNATKLLDENQKSLAELSCDGLCCSAKLYGETKVFDVKLGAYRLRSPNGLLAESDEKESLLGIFTHLPFDSEFEWSLIARASPCYITYLKDSVDQIISFFTSSTDISQSIALEAASAMQLTIDEVKRSAQQQLNRTLKDHTRFLLDLDIAAPKITIPSVFFPDNHHATKLLLDLGNFTLYSQDDYGSGHIEDDIYLKFKMGLKDISAFLVDGDYSWSGRRPNGSPQRSNMNILPVLDKCGVFIELQQIWSEHPSYPSSRLSLRVPSLGFHFSPARYHRLMKVMSLFLGANTDVSLESNRSWNLADFEGWVSVLSWKGVGNREAVWKRRYTCLVGPFIYLLGSPDSKSYKQCTSLRGKQIYHVPMEYVGGEENVIAISDTGVPNSKVVEQGSSLVMRFDNDDLRKTWHNRLQGAVYRTSVWFLVVELFFIQLAFITL